MHIKSLSADMKALAIANRSKDADLLLTGSGKIKVNTLFERTIGRGRQIAARVFGGSYELRRISYDEGKKEIQARLRNQILFFSEKNNINKNESQSIRTTADTMVDDLISDEEIFSNPKKVLSSKMKEKSSAMSGEGAAFSNLSKIYDDKNSSTQFKAMAQTFTSLRSNGLEGSKSTAENVTISAKDMQYAQKIGMYAERAHKEGASSSDAYEIATLALDSTLKDVQDEGSKYNIAVSAFTHAYDMDISDSEKQRQILKCKKDEYAVMGRLSDIRNQRSNIRPGAQLVRPNESGNNVATKEIHTERQQEIRRIITKEINNFATPNEANIYALLVTDPSLSHFNDSEMKGRIAASAMMHADNVGIKDFEKIKAIMKCNIDEIKAMAELRDIRSELYGIK